MEHLDELDEKLIAALVRDGRASYAELAHVVGLSPPAVKRRVDRLVSTGAIERFTAVVSPDALGWRTEAFVEVHCTATIEPHVLGRSLSDITEIVEAFAVTGKADALVRIRARDVEHLERVLGRIRTDPSCAGTESVIVLSRIVRRSEPSP